MANTPLPKSYEQILGDMLSTYLGKIGVNDLNVGSAVSCFFEAMAQAVYRTSGDIFAVLRDFSVDRATDEALKRLAKEERVLPIPAQVATGNITITDTSFTKKSTKIYAGANPPNIGSVVIKVSDASSFPATGALYIGRGTSNIEGPLDYSSIAQVGSFYEITLVNPTTKYHNISENVILSQGGTRNIPAGTTVRTRTAGAAPVINFITIQPAIILDGETTIAKVPVAAQEPGIDGNVPRNSIVSFISTPFAGATVTNPDPFTTGRNEESDEEIRIRIKKARISRGLGTAIAVKNSVLNAQATDENARIISNEIFSDGETTTLFIDNGQGYEEKNRGVGLEYIVNSALGGETHFQLSTGGNQTSVVKAYLESTSTTPFNLYPNSKLAILVGGLLSEHTFLEGDFKLNGYVTAYEVVASINANPNLTFSAQTAGDATQVIITAKNEENEYLRAVEPTSGTNAAAILGISTNEVQTLRLYKNKQALSKNGRPALIESTNQIDWSETLATGDTLILKVDNTQFITYTFTDADFINEGTHSSLSKNNTLRSWVNVFNTKIIGVTASINGNKLAIVSNLGTNRRAALEIDPDSTLVIKGMFPVSGILETTGLEADFKLSRNTAQFKLQQPLQSGDTLTAGTEFTRASITSGVIPGGNIIFNEDAYLWFLVDRENEIVNHGVSPDTFVHFSKQANDTVRIRSQIVDSFIGVQPGDYVIIWSKEFNVANRIEGKIASIGTQVESNDYIEVKLTNSEYNATSNQTPIAFTEGLVIVRTQHIPQKIRLLAGSYNINTVASILTESIEGAIVTVENDENLIITSETRSLYGNISLITFDDIAQSLNFPLNIQSQSMVSHHAFYESANTPYDYPVFVHSSITQDEYADVPINFINSFESAINLSALDLDPNLMVSMLHPYLSNGTQIRDNHAYGQSFITKDLLGNTVEVEQNPIVRRLRVNDRFFLTHPFNFSHNDSIISILDNDASSKTFPIPLYRKALTNNTMAIDSNSFRAYDVDSGNQVEFETYFGEEYDFSNYKVFMKAKNGIDPNSGVDQDAVLIKSAVWGLGGERINVGYTYPTAPNTGIQHVINISENVSIRLSLKSGSEVPNTIDGTTEWDITITPDTPEIGMEEITYTYNGVGTAPTMNSLAAGNYVTINLNGDFNPANTGTFRISSAAASSFTVRRPIGSAVAENNVATLENNTISLYENEDTFAYEIVDYINEKLRDFITAAIIDDNGDTGEGVIFKSTYEDNDFTPGLDGISLVDGVNWIYSSSLDALAPNPIFTFKRSLTLPSFSTNTANAYAFNNSEEIRLVPVTSKQIVELISVLVVSGFGTAGDISTSDREGRVQLATQILGSGGSLQISGGSGNSIISNIVGAASLLPDTGLIRVGINRSAVNGLVVGQMLKLQGLFLQKKDLGIDIATNVTIISGTPNVGQSTITLGNREIYDRFFGLPKNQFRDEERAFHLEKHGLFTCISWDGITGLDPIFSSNVEFNDDNGAIAITYDEESGYTNYTATTGSRNFSEASPGDMFSIQNLADEDNNGVFTVMGVSDDGLTICVNNPHGVDAGAAILTTGNIIITTEIKEGDLVEIGSPFSIVNRGRFRVIRQTNSSIYIDHPTSVEERVVIPSSYRSITMDGSTQFDVDNSETMLISWNGMGTQPDFGALKVGDIIEVGTAFDVDNQGKFMVSEVGSTWIKCLNSKAVSEINISVSNIGGDVLRAHIPALKFYDYENTVPGDSFVVSGNILGDINRGKYIVQEVLNKHSIVVNGLLTDQIETPLGQQYIQIYIEERSAYVGYKKIYNIVIDPSNINRAILIFDTPNQYLKINKDSGGIYFTALGKLGFSELIIKGLDSYRYHTGLIAEANRIVYGDPRDSITYPGVAAAGAEIFIKPPLIRRIEISINVRVQTGIPFSKIVEQVRSNIASLINSSPIGESIAISDIIAVVNVIPGTKAVSITSPAYSPANDVIVIGPSEKPLVLDLVNDITVAKVGN